MAESQEQVPKKAVVRRRAASRGTATAATRAGPTPTHRKLSESLMKRFNLRPASTAKARGDSVPERELYTAHRAPKSEKAAQTVAERWAFLEAQYAGYMEREPLSDGQVVVRLTYGDGDTIAGKGPTTAAATEALSKKLKRRGV